MSLRYVDVRARTPARAIKQFAGAKEYGQRIYAISVKRAEVFGNWKVKLKF